LHGVLHAAGVPGIGLMTMKTNAQMERVLAPKVGGTMALAQALAGVPIDFLALFSSVGSATGALGQTDYCSANAFLDAFAVSGALAPAKVMSIGWGEWLWNAWSAGLAGYEPSVREYLQQNRREFGLTFDEGWRSLLRALAGGQPHVFVSTQDFAAVVEGSRRFTIADLKRGGNKESEPAGRHPRPDLSTQFAAPRTPAERTIAEIWSEALGIDNVGVHDNFFELGGNSLIGVSIIASIRRALKLAQLPAHIIYQASTIAALAAHVDSSSDDLVSANGTHAVAADRAQRRRERLSHWRS
jgi:hypothetical protein